MTKPEHLESIGFAEKPTALYQVVYGNYFPREVESTWPTKELAEARCDQLSEEQNAQGLGLGMWVVEPVELSVGDPIAYINSPPRPEMIPRGLDHRKIAELERAVILAAIGRRLCERHLFPRGAPDSGNTLLNRLFVDEQQAVDALLQARGNNEPS